mmetsp:Transcript_27319/g.76282  ORF Transcript_27319/g.76282 Transcript_27319/m.76282 type:complete len:268 (-) Transcript_27319:936-1739(-)
MMTALSCCDRGATLPSASSTWLLRSRMPSGAPFTMSIVWPPAAVPARPERVTRFAPPSPGPRPRTSTLMLLRSRSNSSVASFSYLLAQKSQVPSAWCAGSFLRACTMPAWTAASGAPSFSASTFRAASVGLPRALNCPVSPLYSIPLSLHRAQTAAKASRFASQAGAPSTSPSSGWYVVPETFKVTRLEGRFPILHMVTADIWLVVRVPVLSLQMTEVQPSVSTDGSLRTMAFFFAILRVPRARQAVTTAGRPSGMAATAKATAILK